MAYSDDIAQRLVWRGERGYEEARASNIWNRRVPLRYPEVIAQPDKDDDVVAAVRLARQRGLKIAIRSGGHSWAATFLRDGGMLIDLSRMRVHGPRQFSRGSEARNSIVHCANTTCFFRPVIA
jgi:FAD/FMN-containing dehydrogenase